jgi:outer membrane biosynthesis protein TonB
VCTGGKICDFVVLRVQRQVVQVHNQGLLSSAWAWRVVDVSEDESAARAWLEAATGTDPSALDAPPTKVTGPPGAVSVGSPQGGSVANASRVIAAMRAGFRRCYHRALAENPQASGTVRLEIDVGSDGSVTRAKAITAGNFPSSAAACIEARARAAQFDPPQGGTAKLVVPLTMTPN